MSGTRNITLGKVLRSDIIAGYLGIFLLCDAIASTFVLMTGGTKMGTMGVISSWIMVSLGLVFFIYLRIAIIRHIFTQNIIRPATITKIVKVPGFASTSIYYTYTDTSTEEKGSMSVFSVNSTNKHHLQSGKKINVLQSKSKLFWPIIKEVYSI